MNSIQRFLCNSIWRIISELSQWCRPPLCSLHSCSHWNVKCICIDAFLFHSLFSRKLGLSPKTCTWSHLNWYTVGCKIFIIFFITYFHRNHSRCHRERGVNAEWHRCVAANAHVCLSYGFGLWRVGYVQISPGSEESTDTGTHLRIVGMHLTVCLSFIHLYISGICACYTTRKVFCDDVFIFSVWVLPVAIKLVRVPDSSWLHCLH